MGPEFYDLPFNERPDLTPYLIHLTRATKSHSAFENLKLILRSGILNASGNEGFVKGPSKAACFMDVPFSSLKFLLSDSNTSRYSPYGIFCGKEPFYKEGGRPVLYLSDEEMNSLGVVDQEKWRVVKLELGDNGKWTNWQHEREWRIKGNLDLANIPIGILVRRSSEARELMNILLKDPKEFRINPLTIIPLQVICQHLIYLES